MMSTRALAALTFATAVALGIMVGSIIGPVLAQQGGPQNGTPVEGVPINRSTVNSSVTITTGNTFQPVLPSVLGTSTQRQSLTVQNNNTTTDSCWLFLGATASATKATSIILLQGQAYTRYFPYVPSDAIQVTCASTSDTVYVENN
jgi:hypothetical protein